MSRTRPSVVRLIAFLLPLFCLAQTPTIGIVEIYGARKVQPVAIRKVAGVRPGGRLPASKAIVEERLQTIPGVETASLEAACCENNQVILYIGIRESGSVPPRAREYPSDVVEMPEAVSKAYLHFLDLARDAGRAGGATEDLSQGYSLFSAPAIRDAQMAFIPLASEYITQLRDVLKRSDEDDHRAMAAYILGYFPEKKEVLDDLAAALSDPDATVRGNATRALGAIAVYAQRNPAAALPIQPSWFVNLFDSPVWTDRNYAAVALVNLTESRKPEMLAPLRQHAVPALVEMARWKHAEHALPAYILLGRTAGIAEKELQSAWSAGQREKIIVRAISGKK